ncbi:MAG: Ldh family oxidoreductase [Candidatus Bathyarchaeia archaeon]
MPILREDQLRGLYEALAKKFGAPGEEASIFADALVQADLRGFDGQGILLMNEHWLKFLRARAIKPGSRVSIVKETSAMALLDGGGGLGQVIGTKAMKLAVEKARKSGVGIVSVRNSNDWGMTGYYSMKALEYDCIGIAMATFHNPFVAPWGGRDRILGSNPFSYAIPARRHWPIVLDMATAATSGSRIYEAMIHGKKIPEGLVLDAYGSPTTNPRSLYEGGALMSFGPRGYGLLVMVEILAGPLSDMGLASDREAFVGQLCVAIDVNQFTPIDEFKEKVDRLIDKVKSSRVASGFTEILVPGEKEFREKQRRTSEGISVPDNVWQDVTKIAEELGVDWKQAVRWNS